MSGLCEGRVAVVTGAGRGLGREHALLLAAEGAKVVVNDLGVGTDGSGADSGPANEVVEEIRASGGDAIADGGDCSNFEQSGALIQKAVDAFGRLDILINNAGILRDRMIFSMSEQDWDAVVQVHLKGHFCPTRHAAAYWREQAKAGVRLDARIINTASPSGLFGNVGQSNYGAAKAGIAAFTQVCALELARYGVTANCLAPTAMTRLLGTVMTDVSDEAQEAMSPRWIAAVAVWLASPEARHISGRVFDVRGQRLAIAEGWHRGPEGVNPGNPTDMGAVVNQLFAEVRPNASLDGADAPERFVMPT